MVNWGDVMFLAQIQEEDVAVQSGFFFCVVDFLMQKVNFNTLNDVTVLQKANFNTVNAVMVLERYWRCDGPENI